MASGHWEVCAEGPPGYGVDFLKALVTTCPLCDLLFVVQVHVSSSEQPLLSMQRAFRGHMAGWARVWWILFIQCALPLMYHWSSTGPLSHQGLVSLCVGEHGEFGLFCMWYPQVCASVLHTLDV